MRALFTKSAFTTGTTTSDDHHNHNHNHSSTPPAPPKPRPNLYKRASTPQLSSTTTPPVTISSPSGSLPRRVRSKPSIRSSVGSSISSQRGEDGDHDDHYHNDVHVDENNNNNSSSKNNSSRNRNRNSGNGNSDKTLVRPSFLHRLSPGLAARVKLLDGNTKTTAALNRGHGNVGRIPEEHIKELDSLHRQRSLTAKVERKRKSRDNIKGGYSHSHSYQLEVPRQEAKEEEEGEEEEEEEEGKEGEEGDHPADLELQSVDSFANLSPEQIMASIPQDPKPVIAHGEMPISGMDADRSNIDPEMPSLRPEVSSDSQTGNRSSIQTDFENYLQTSAENDAKRSSQVSQDGQDDNNMLSRSSSISSSIHRTDSLYSFTRNSFSSQLSQLTSMSLPQASSLAASIASMSNAPAAINALVKSAEQIQVWIRRASNVLAGLYAEDDVEWAAAGGRDGLEGVDKAISRFESVVNVYVKSIEEVQLRADIIDVDPESLKKLVKHMESILNNWAHVKSKLKQVKEQVELAMEWEELWNNVLGDVRMEVDDLSRLIFEMEERRHLVMNDGLVPGEPGRGVDINDLETIVEETPSRGDMNSNKRFSIGPVLASTSPAATPVIHNQHNDRNLSDLMGLFARMQPLRASLDFLPMRLSMFQSRAENVFPSACQEIDDRQNDLERSYRRLQDDAEALRKELGEDRWVRVFRNATSQAQKMYESVERGIVKVQESIEMGAHFHNPAVLTKRIENYEAKKTHYVPAIERVITIVQKGVKDRLTVNGEILRSLADMRSRLDAVNASIRVMDNSLEDLNAFTAQHVRDSASSSITMDSPGAGGTETPGSSPSSSAVMTPGASRKTPSVGTSSRRGSSVGSATRTTMSKVKRYSGIPQMSSALANRKSSIPKPPSTVSSPEKSKTSTSPSPASLTPGSAARKARPSPSPMNNKPRWNAGPNTSTLDTGHNFRSLYATTPSPYAKTTPSSTLTPSTTPRRPLSTMGLHSSSYSRDNSRSPIPPTARSASRVSGRLASRSPAPATRAASPAPATAPTRSILDPPPYSKRRPQPPRPAPSPEPEMPNLPRMRQSYNGMSPFSSRSVGLSGSGRGGGHEVAGMGMGMGMGSLPEHGSSRPGTALGHSAAKRISLLPTAKGRSGSGRDSSNGSRGKVDERPPWR